MIKEIRNSKNPILSSVYNYARQSMTGEWDRNGEWRYVSIAEYAGLVHEWIKELPTDFDIVCAIPRSGFIPGTIIATELNKPLTAPDQLLSGNIWGRSAKNIEMKHDYKILLVDDSMGEGTTLVKYKNHLQERYPDMKITTAVVFGWSESRDLVDLCCYPHSSNMRLMFEYNLTRLKYGELSCDLDGVLCEDYTVALPEPEYVKHITNARPYRIPTFRIKSIITNREEKHRGITEHWLIEHKVEYDTLVMNGNNENTLQFKINALMDNRPSYYWESDPVLSEGIFKATGIPVLCINTGQFHS
jgi:hypothetical protein